MIKPILLCAVVGLLGVGCASAQAGASEQSGTLACAAAEAALPPKSSSVLIFSNGSPERDTPDIVNASQADLALGWAGQVPDKSALRNLRVAIQETALSCPNVHQAATAAGEVLDETEGLAKVRGTPPGKGGIYLYRISGAALSADRSQAVVAIATASNQLGGGTTLIALKHTANGWMKVGQRTLLGG